MAKGIIFGANLADPEGVQKLVTLGSDLEEFGALRRPYPRSGLLCPRFPFWTMSRQKGVPNRHLTDAAGRELTKIAIEKF